MKKAATKKPSNGSDTKPFNIRLMTMNALVGKEEPNPRLGVRTAQDAKQDKALKDFIKKKEAQAKKTGTWNNGYTN